MVYGYTPMLFSAMSPDEDNYENGNKLLEKKVSAERIAVYKVIENLIKHARHCLPCFTKFSINLYCLLCLYTNDVIDLLPQHLRNHQILYLGPWQNVVPMTSL